MIVEIKKLDNFGRGIAYINYKIVFVENALPGEIVKIEITNNKKKYQEAIVTEYIEKSPSRIKEICPFNSECGGCNIEHLNFIEENNYKEEKVKDILIKYLSITESIIKPIKYHEPYNYRNKIVLHGKDKKLGLYQKSTNEIIEIDYCYLVNDKINNLISILKDNNKNITEAIIKTSNDNKTSMIKITGEVKDINSILNNTDVLIINDMYYTKKEDIITKIGNYKFHENINSFFQVNNTLTKELYDEIKNTIKKIKPSNVLDLYCGTGTIGIYINKYCDSIIGIDSNKSNIEDANKNKELNKINNIEFICNKVENEIANFKNIDYVIVDPPRKGLDNKTKDYLKNWKNLKGIVYVSCDIITLARDLKDLEENYKVLEVTPFNMFPRTYHCESVSVLERR